MQGNDVKTPGKRWERAIEEAQRQIVEYRKRIHSLSTAISTFKKNIERGEPWPEKPSTGENG